MTVINTNVGALMARTYASKAAQKTETSMERLHQACALTVLLMMRLVWRLLTK